MLLNKTIISVMSTINARACSDCACMQYLDEVDSCRNERRSREVETVLTATGTCRQQHTTTASVLLPVPSVHTRAHARIQYSYSTI